jgi:hypothetical protein
MKLVSGSSLIAATAILAVLTGGMYVSRWDITLTETTASDKAKRIFAAYLKDAGLVRSAFHDPFVEMSNGDALVNFRLRSLGEEGVIVPLGKNGSTGIAPHIPSHDFRAVTR